MAKISCWALRWKLFSIVIGRNDLAIAAKYMLELKDLKTIKTFKNKIISDTATVRGDYFCFWLQIFHNYVWNIKMQ